MAKKSMFDELSSFVEPNSEALDTIEKDPTATVEISIEDIRPFKNHPYKVNTQEESFRNLVNDIRDNGQQEDVIVRRLPLGLFEMISGHRRMAAMKELGIKTVKAKIKDLTDDQAIIAMVSANNYRDSFLPSERAKAYKMQMEALQRLGKQSKMYSGTENLEISSEISDEISASNPHKMGISEANFQNENRGNIADLMGEKEGVSQAQIRRFLKLNNLKTELLQFVDENKVSVAIGADIADLPNSVQTWFTDYVRNGGKIKPQQIAEVKRRCKEQTMSDARLNQFFGAKEARTTKTASAAPKFDSKKIASYFPKDYTVEQMEEVLYDLLEKWKKQA